MQTRSSQIREAEARVGATADDIVREEISLRLADRVISPIVQDEDLRVDLARDERLALLQVPS
jgi:hypothetical protein